MSYSPNSPPVRPSSPASIRRGRGGSSSPRPPPSYLQSSLDRSPAVNPLVLDERTRVPPPIYLRSTNLQPSSGKGVLKIHVPAWGTALIRPPRPLIIHPLDSTSNERGPPSQDTVLSGSLEVIMQERRKVLAISVGVQSVCRIHMGEVRGWEEDGIFERGVEILSGRDEEGIWLEKGSQSFCFSILLPATLATTDRHAFGRVGYILTARVEGIPFNSSISSIFKSVSPVGLDPDIPFVGDFERVIARSDKLIAGSQSARSRSASRSRSGRRGSSSRTSNIALGVQEIAFDDEEEVPSAIAIGQGSPSLGGLYTRRQSSEMFSSSIPPLSLSPESPSTEALGSQNTPERSEKNGWMKGNIVASRELLVHATSPTTGSVGQLDIRKEGFVEGLGSWRFSASADVFSISSVILLSISFPTPGPTTTIFLVRLILSQVYTITSPRTPNKSPFQPESAKHHVLYQVGRAHKAGEKFPSVNAESLWRGPEAGGTGNKDGNGGWKVRAVARIPSHEKVRPSTNEGTITPVRVTHDLILQVYYSLHGRSVTGTEVSGPGELRMMSVKFPTMVPSCHCVSDALNLPTYETSRAQISPSPRAIDCIFSSPDPRKWCMCGSTFAELGEKTMKRMQASEREDMEVRMRMRAGSDANKANEGGDRGVTRDEDGSV